LSSIKAERGISRERGVSLVVALIFLIILTILGLTAMRVATMEERMSGNSRDRSLAFQAAEAALRDAELDIETTGRVSMTKADATCTNGLCCNVSGLICIEPATPVYDSMSLSAAPSVKYGKYTGALSIGGLPIQPRYLIEPFMPDGKNYYRITVRGYGVNADTQVTLQEIYNKE
jgi:type IV pilus assembly protein PilX